MNEKVFDLLEKMYIEMQEMKSNMVTKQEIEEMKLIMATKQETEEIKLNMATKDDVKRLENNMLRMENEMKNDIKALYDGYKQSIEGITEIRDRLDKLSEKVENQEIRLQVIKSMK